MASATTITSEEKVLMTVTPLTLAGNPATVDGDVQYEVTSGDATVEVVPDTNGTQAYLVSGSPDTLSTIRYYADGDLSEEVAMVEDTVTLTVTQPGVSSLGVTFGTPEPK
jgi:hypothetical protein